jgi:hypothetical protein
MGYYPSTEAIECQPERLKFVEAKLLSSGVGRSRGRRLPHFADRPVPAGYHTGILIERGILVDKRSRTSLKAESVIDVQSSSFAEGRRRHEA